MEYNTIQALMNRAGRCKGLLTIKECADALNKFQNNKTPGSDGLTIEFYRLFWDAIGHFMVDSFKCHCH